MNDPIQHLWAAQPIVAQPPDPADIARRAARLHRRVLIRDASEYIAATMVIAVFAGYALRSADRWLWAGCALIIAGTFVMLANLWRHRVRAGPALLASPSVAYLRHQLTVQRDALAGVWRWYLAPVVPGLIVFLAATARQLAAELSVGATVVAVTLAGGLVAVVFFAIYRLNLTAARQLDREIALLADSPPPISREDDHHA